MKGIYGDLVAIANGPLEAMEKYPDYFVGIGAFMEGIDNNPVVYDLLFVLLDGFASSSGNVLEKEVRFERVAS